MVDSGNGSDNANFDVFRDCVFSSVVEKTTRKTIKGRKRAAPARKTHAQAVERPGTGGDADEDADPSELAEFSDYLAAESFECLPSELKNLSHHALQNDPTLSNDKWSLPLTLSVLEELSSHIPGEVTDSLTAYGLINPPSSDVQSFMTPIFSGYISAVTTVPRPPQRSETRTTACEICDRDWVPMTYHHLIPRQVHAKVLKRQWHEESQLNSVAWLCRACHSFVHRMASNEELARQWFTVEMICQREDVRKWAMWVHRVRWKKS